MKKTRIAYPLLSLLLLSSCNNADNNNFDNLELPNIGMPTTHVMRAPGIENGVQLSVIVEPANATDKRIIWSSSDVRAVDFVTDPGNGLVANIYAKTPFTHTVIIRATSAYNSEIYATCSVTFFRQINEVRIYADDYRNQSVDFYGSAYDTYAAELNLEVGETRYIYLEEFKKYPGYRSSGFEQSDEGLLDWYPPTAWEIINSTTSIVKLMSDLNNYEEYVSIRFDIYKYQEIVNQSESTWIYPYKITLKQPFDQTAHFWFVFEDARHAGGNTQNTAGFRIKSKIPVNTLSFDHDTVEF